MDVSNLIDALNFMLAAESRNGQKNIKVIEWFDNEALASGRAGIINGMGNIGNRIPEQFKHKSAHVIFIYNEPKAKDKLLEKIPPLIYSELETVLLLGRDSDKIDLSTSADLLVFKNKSKLISFYTQNYSNLTTHNTVQPLDKKLNLSEVSRTCLPKPFILLAGISGTGKTRFVEKQAKAWGESNNYCLVPVRPDWHEPSDLLGYISRINGTQYIATDFLKFMVKAWVNTAESVTGNNISNKNFSEILPYWLCLDEMNLAPVEQYFADYLSILETRKWYEGSYSCNPIVNRSLLETLKCSTTKDGSNSLDMFWNDIFRDINCDFKDDLCQHFLKNGISIPPNLIVAGTVNMDETTHGFSRKVIDRALTIDFQEFFPNDFDCFFEGQKKPKTFSFSTETQLTKDKLNEIIIDQSATGGSRSIEFLKTINAIFLNTPYQLAFRALNELLLSVYCTKPTNDAELLAVWDDFLMQKILPRIEGDTQKLKYLGNKLECPSLEPATYGKATSLIHKLYSVLEKSNMLGGIWNAKIRVDLLRECDKPIECRSKTKLEWMLRRLKSNHFTDFWV